ncbi:hypothetical protein LTR70_007824 [Exophiala xenobiotica]|uniref:GH16 domain-containing protein n=1 Tax=Lithohypha guttulata TaxID=1690604 RepID=A0ABR0K2X8_9EURO|nr:hypothetical protein LTR24_007435 [Lithohypha guttulata]KAK5313069.1 hypothetical protein LTR70_007824 [Exophiala xenobiotica]
MAFGPPVHKSQYSAESIGYASGTDPYSRDEKRNPFDTPNETRNPFDTPHRTPYGSAPASATGSRITLARSSKAGGYFHSRRVRKGQVDKPWLTRKDPKEKWITIIPMIGIFVGLALSAYLVYDGLKAVVTHKYCSIYSTDFSEGIDDSYWTKEAEVGGFSNGQFEQTTITDENIFMQDGAMVIKPTLQDESLITQDTVINLFDQGICSSDVWSNCITSTNTTNGTIIQPVKSGRINLKKAAIKYGRIEVEAQLPRGDWLWPAIWLLPVSDAYGAWPTSGEIDILESRGNAHSYAQGGNNIMSSALHWGPDSANDAWWRTNAKRSALHSTFADGYHTFGLEWSEKYLFTYLDNRLAQVMYVPFNPKQGLWQRGDFPLANGNGTVFVDPWSQTGQPSTPFDQDFYLIINLAVGGQNGWFEDGKSQKPWVDRSPTAKKDFWNARDEWMKSWDEGSPELRVRSVKVWQQQGFNGCDNGVLVN